MPDFFEKIKSVQYSLAFLTLYPLYGEICDWFWVA